MSTTNRLGIAGDYNQQVGMTLAEIAYAEPQYLQKQLSYKSYATEGRWELRWVGISPGNQMYVAKDLDTHQWVVSVRGSMTDPFSEAFWVDWFEQDADIIFTRPLPFGDAPGAIISYGAYDGFIDLISMRDSTSGQTLVEFLKANVELELLSIVVVGHSLGGCLASVLAPYLYETLCKPAGKPSDCIVPMSFAAPTAGNTQFAEYVERVLYGYPFRYVNDLDIAPQSWSLNGLVWIMNTYSPSPQISDFFYGLLDTLWWALYEGSYNYQQPGPPDVVQDTVQRKYWWFEEAGYHHSGENYLKLYDAPPVIFPYPPKPQLYGRYPRRERPAVD